MIKHYFGLSTHWVNKMLFAAELSAVRKLSEKEHLLAFDSKFETKNLRSAGRFTISYSL